MKVWPGHSYPLGATYDGRGTNFSLFSYVAEKVELCLFDDRGKETRVALPEVTGFRWHGYLPDIEPGQRYGYRVYGPWDPAAGHRCNPAKLLLDPYAKVIEGGVEWDDAVFSYRSKAEPDTIEETDSSPYVPRSVVCKHEFDWAGDRRLDIPFHETVIYETHVKGFTARHPEIPKKLRGTYAGLGHPAAVKYLEELGVTAVELQPIHQFVHRRRLVEKGLRNYWGYDTIGFFAPHDEYSSATNPRGLVTEFKEMVKALHQAGIEVILDVVYNHTAEGDHLGPTLCFKGIDNASYYHLAEDRRLYQDYTGTGNSLNVGNPHVLQMVMDSLRYWILDMHVDGFRFDLCSALARELHDVDHLSAFFDLIHQDPIISQVKLIAEPWDVGEGGYQVGNFPPVWSEWNGKYRDWIRDFWRGEEESLSELGDRFTGSSDLYKDDGRMPFASINFVTAHDGFTLHDLVSYEEKHNEANQEDNRDGTDDNRSWNCGVEGPTDDPEVVALRKLQKRNFLATLFLSQGVPMLLGGDELGRTQEGNNNAYCQDNEVSWYDWESADGDLLEYCRRLIGYRQAHPALRRRGWFHGRKIHGSDIRDISWFTPEGHQMDEDDWEAKTARSLGIFINGDAIPNPNPKGPPVTDDSFYVIINTHDEPVDCRLPPARCGDSWIEELDTSKGWLDGAKKSRTFPAREKLRVEPRCLRLFRQPCSANTKE
jgi:glycogen operon protein